MLIVKTTTCPRCDHGIKVSVRQMPKQMYTVLFYDGRDKNSRSSLTMCPRCKTDLFQSEIVKALTGLHLPQLAR